MARTRRAQTFVFPFTDHKGHAARLVFEAPVSCPLPHLYAFAIYFTHPDASPDNVDPAALLSAVHRSSEPPEIWLELYFLPNATVEDCIAHYHGGKAKRGDYTAQIAAFRDISSSTSSSPVSEASGSGLRLPGLVPSYFDYFKPYHGLLYLCIERHWSLGKREMCQVRFDLYSDEQQADWHEGSDPEVRPAIHLQWWPLDENSPENNPQFIWSISQHMAEISSLQREEVTSPPWYEAVDRGWAGWPLRRCISRGSWS